MEGTFYFGQEDKATAEITYANEQLEPADVEDILERLHIGTLRREQLKVREEKNSSSKVPTPITAVPTEPGHQC